MCIRDSKTTVHVVGLPDSLRDALFTLMPPRKEGGYLNTKVLKDDLRCWLDRAVELNPVRPNVHTDSWLIALAPIDLAKLCNVIAVWISSRKDIDTQSPAYRKVMGMLHPETFEEAVRGEEICLFSGDGRPTGRLTFPAFSAQVADAIADIPLELANGMVENFSRVSRGNGNVYEPVSYTHLKRGRAGGMGPPGAHMGGLYGNDLRDGIARDAVHGNRGYRRAAAPFVGAALRGRQPGGGTACGA